jgi:DNA-binding NarL/FixJ family response regulator
LNISIKTVEFHKTSIMDALGIRTIAELTRYAVDHGIVG